MSAVTWTQPPGEPAVSDWQTLDAEAFVERFVPPRGPQRPTIVAVDGRSAAGKSTLSEAIRATGRRVEVVHVDDISWHHSPFGWSDLLHDDVLVPVHAGRQVAFTPPAWGPRGRQGAVVVDSSCDVVLVEGVGAGRREVTALIDLLVWVQSDVAEAERRGIARDIELGVNGDVQQSIDFWHDWIRQEVEFLSADRPWERADVVVAGSPPYAAPIGQVALHVGPAR